MRAIDADKFIKYLKQSLKDAILSLHAQSEGVLLLTKIVIALEKDLSDEDITPTIKLPASQQWIPCDERLPEEEDEFLVTIRDNSGVWTTSYDFDGEEFGLYAHRDDDLIWCPAKNVVAWAPLPGPYKGGEQNGQDD